MRAAAFELIYEACIRELVVEDAFEFVRGLCLTKEVVFGDRLVPATSAPVEAKLTLDPVDVFRPLSVPDPPVRLVVSSSCNPSSHFRLERVATELLEILRERRRDDRT